MATAANFDVLDFVDGICESSFERHRASWVTTARRQREIQSEKGYLDQMVLDLVDCKELSSDDEPVVVVKARVGGGNRRDYQKSVHDRMAKHPAYITSEDWEYDCTYTFFYFRVPEEDWPLAAEIIKPTGKFQELRAQRADRHARRKKESTTSPRTPTITCAQYEALVTELARLTCAVHDLAERVTALDHH